MGGVISGSVTINFQDDLYWVTEGEGERPISEKRALTGEIIQSWLTEQSNQVDEYHKFKFTWEPRATIQALETLKKLRTSFYLKTSASASSLHCRFAKSNPITKKPVPPEEFFSPDAVEGYDTDLYNGELHLIVRV